MLESTTNPGEVVLLASTAVSALPVSITTQPNAVSGQSVYTGMRLLIVVQGNSATGTITVTGKDFSQAQNALAETTPTIPVAGTTSNLQSTGYEYVTAGVYSTVNASGITVSGLTGGTVKIYGIQAARALVPAVFEAEEKIPPHSPVEQRATLSKNTNIQKLNKIVDIGKFEQVFLPDNCANWFGRAVIGSNPTQATIPASPTALKAAVTPTGSISLTTQPNTLGPGQLLQFVVSGGTTAVGTIAITGTNVFGQAITETVVAGKPGGTTGDGTYYSQQVFASVGASGITFTGLTGGTPLCAVNGLIASQETYQVGGQGANAGDILQSACIEWYTGTDAIVHPFSYFSEITIEGSPEKEAKISGKGGAQDQLVIGNRTTTPMTNSTGTVAIGSIGALASIWQPFDIGLSGWQTAIYIDALSGTAGTTGYNVVLDYKVVFKIPRKPSYPSVNWQRYQALYRQPRETEIEFTADFVDVVQYENFRTNVKQLLSLQFIGPYMGSNGGTVYNKNWTFTIPFKIIEAKRDAGKQEKVEAHFKALAEYTPSLGYEILLVTQNQLPPNYAS